MSGENDIESAAVERDTPLERYQRHADLPFMVLSVAVIPLVIVEFFVDLRPRAERGVEITYTLIWAAFVADYVIKLLLSPNKREYFRTEWLALLLNILTVPVALSPFAILRAARSLRLLRVFRFGAVAARGAHRVVALPRSANSQLAVAASSFVLVTLVSAVLLLAVEEGGDATEIGTMSDALWWSVSTVSTVGYGDVVPKSTAGRVLALIPMIAGVTLVAVLASSSGMQPSLGDLARMPRNPRRLRSSTSSSVSSR